MTPRTWEDIWQKRTTFGADAPVVLSSSGVSAKSWSPSTFAIIGLAAIGAVVLYGNSKMDKLEIESK